MNHNVYILLNKNSYAFMQLKDNFEKHIAKLMKPTMFNTIQKLTTNVIALLEPFAGSKT